MKRKVSFEKVVEAIEQERRYQDAKHGTIEEHSHTPKEWLEILEDEMIKAKSAYSEEEMKKEILQVIATGVACLEQHGIFTRFNE